MRDHYFHDAKILAGMWSAKLGSTSWTDVDSDRKSRAMWEEAFKKVFKDPLAYWKHKFVKDADQQILARYSRLTELLLFISHVTGPQSC